MEYLITYHPPRPDFPATLTEAEGEIVGRHFAYLQGLHREGKAVYVGRREDGAFGLAVVEADSDAAARALAQEDPAVRERIFTVSVDAFRTVLIRR